MFGDWEPAQRSDMTVGRCLDREEGETFERIGEESIAIEDLKGHIQGLG